MTFGFGLRRLAEPQTEPVTLADAKIHLRVDHAADDAYIAALIRAARGVVEERARVSLHSQRWRLVLDAFPPFGLPIQLPRGPVATVDSFTYLNPSDALVTFTDYALDGTRNPPILYPSGIEAWPAARNELHRAALTIEYTAGFNALPGSPSGRVPEGLRHALLFLIGHLYRTREAVSETAMVAVPLAFDALLDPYVSLGRV